MIFCSTLPACGKCAGLGKTWLDYVGAILCSLCWGLGFCKPTPAMIKG